MTDETLLAPGETTQVVEGTGAAEQPKGGDTATTTTMTTDTTADGKTAAADGKPDGEKSTDAPTGAPEKYEFTAGEGKTFDSTVLATFEEVARELNLPQDKAQSVLDKMAPVIEARQQERIAAIRTEWETQTKADKEFGGEKLPENLAVAKAAVDKFASPALKTLLNQTGLGNHPEVVRMFLQVGRSISEDTLVPDGGSHLAPPGNDARALYPNSNMT